MSSGKDKPAALGFCSLITVDPSSRKELGHSSATVLLSLTIARFPPDFARDVAISIWSLWLPYPGGGLFCKNAFSDIAVFKGTRDKINIFGDLSHSKSLILDVFFFFLSLTQT